MAALIQPVTRNFPDGTTMSNKTTAMWANTRVSERLSITYAKAHVMEILLGGALKTISTYLDHISPAVIIDDAFAAEAK
jgi:hypothetical protein